MASVTDPIRLAFLALILFGVQSQAGIRQALEQDSGNSVCEGNALLQRATGAKISGDSSPDYKALAINLDSRPDRWQHMTKELESLTNVGFLEYERLQGVNGSTMEVSEEVFAPEHDYKPVIKEFVQESLISSNSSRLDLEAFCECARVGGRSPPNGRSFAQRELQMLLQEMRQEMRIFAYPTTDDCVKFPPGQAGYLLEKSIYQSEFPSSQAAYLLEKSIYERIESSKMLVDKHEKANVFYIPTFTACWRFQVQNRSEGGERAGVNLRKTVQRAAQLALLNEGRKHFWVSTHDMGKLEPVWYANHSLTNQLALHGSGLVNTAELNEYHKAVGRGLPTYMAFNATKDVSLACNGNISRFEEGLKRVNDPGAARQYSVFFAGIYDEGYAGNVRYAAIQSINKLSKERPSGKRSVPAPWGSHLFAERLSDSEYLKALEGSDFCLAPTGSRVQSPRLFEMIWFGCIPVIIADGYQLPGSCFFEWKDMSIQIPEKDVDKVGEILRAWSADKERVLQFRERLLQVRKHLAWQNKEGDAFELAMLDVYLKQQRKCRT